MPLIVDQSNNVTCLVETCCNAITVSWTLGGKEIPGILHVSGNDGNFTTFVSKLSYDVMAGDENSQLVCILNAPCVVSYERVSNLAKAIDVYCECSS